LKNCILGTKEYNQKKIKILTNFYKASSANQSLAPLPKMTVDCSRCLLVLCCGVRTDNTKEALNACVLVYGLSRKKKPHQNINIFTLPKEAAALSPLQPATVSKLH
jgi:hypothetical protein